MDSTSLAHPCATTKETIEQVECFRHEGEECPRRDGPSYRPQKYCAGCGEPAGRPSEGGKSLRLHEGSWLFEKALASE